MEKPQIVFHVLIENRYEAGLIEQALRNAEYDCSFVSDTKGLPDINNSGFHVLLLEPSMSQWDWLGLLLESRREHPCLSVVLYSREINVEDNFQSLMGKTGVFLTNDVMTLKVRLAEIIGDTTTQIIEPEKSILFVDDEPGILSSYSRILRKCPWKVFTASSAEKALETLQAESIDLVVTDMKMPQVHGIELVSKIRDQSKTLPILVCSAYHGMKDDQELQFHGIAGFVEKPVDAEVLLAKIEEVLGH